MNHYYDKIYVTCEELNEINLNKLSNVNNNIKELLDDLILEKLKNKIGDKCNRYGYIKKDTIKILDISTPKIISSHFNGNLYYRIEYNAIVINPKKDEIIDCVITKKNPFGLLCKNDCMVIIIPSDLHNNGNDLKLLNINDNIKIHIVERKYEINDDQILVVGKFIKKNN